MQRAVTNRDFPMLADILRRLFGIELDYDPTIFPDSLYFDPLKSRIPKPRNTIRSLASSARRGYMVFRSLSQLVRSISDADPNRVRIIFVEDVEDLSFGIAPHTNIIGFNMSKYKMAFVGVPPRLDPISRNCAYVPETMDGYLIAVTLHELYENLTGNTRHCRNPGVCINSVCRLYENGTCRACMGGLIEKKYPDLRLEDLYCEENLAKLRRTLGRSS